MNKLLNITKKKLAHRYRDFISDYQGEGVSGNTVVRE